MKKDFLKKASTDFALTIGATVVLVGTLQLLVYPFLAWKLDGDRYGLFLVAIGIVNALEPSFGSTLCNTRNRTGRLQIPPIHFCPRTGSGDCDSVLATSIDGSIDGVSCWDPYGYEYREGVLSRRVQASFQFQEAVASQPLNCFGLCGRYGRCFRKRILAFRVHTWRSICPRMFCTMLKRVFRTVWQNKAFWVVAALIASNLITYSSVYVDRLLLYPALGPSAVSTYYVATFFGKTFSFFSSPISSIMLSYMSDGVVKITVRRYHLVNLFILAVGLFMYAIAFFIGPLFAMILYPTLYDQALSLMPLGNAASIFAVVNSFNMVVVLKVAPPRLQVVSSLFRLVLYAASIAFSSWVGSLWVLCLLMLISNAVSYLFTYSVGLFYMKRSGAMVRTGANS